MKVMTNACDTLRTKLVEGVTANTERCKDYVMNSIGIVTLLKPHFGYQKCAAIAKEGYTTCLLYTSPRRPRYGSRCFSSYRIPRCSLPCLSLIHI